MLHRLVIPSSSPESVKFYKSNLFLGQWRANGSAFIEKSGVSHFGTSKIRRFVRLNLVRSNPTDWDGKTWLSTVF